MDSETNPATVLFTESQRLGAFVHFWRCRIEIEKSYLDNLSGLPIPDQPINGQLQELAHKTRELLMDEIEERRRGLEKLQAAYKALSNEFWTEEGTSYFDQWGKTMEMSLRRIETSTTEVTVAESSAERLAVEERETSSAKNRSNALSRLLTTRNAQPHGTSSFLSADSAYRQKVQQLNDEIYTIQNETPQTERHAEHDRKCIVALRCIVSTFSDVQRDLAQVLNVRSSQLCNVSSSVDASVESASFAERLDEGFTSLRRFTSLIQPYRYTSYEISSSLRPTTMIFGCPLPDELDGASIGQRAVYNAFEMILSSAAKSFDSVICNGQKQQGDDIKLSALQLESLWDSSQRNGGPGAVNYLANTASHCLLVYFFTRLPTPFLPLQDQEIKSLAKLPCHALDEISSPFPLGDIASKAGNRMSTARRCNLARFITTLNRHKKIWSKAMLLQPDLIQILTRTPSFPTPRLVGNFNQAVRFIPIGKNDEDANALILPNDFIEVLRHDGLLGDW